PDGRSIGFSDPYTYEVEIWDLNDLQNPGPQHLFPKALALKRGRWGVYAITNKTLAVSLDNLFELTNITTGKTFRASVADNITSLALADDGKLVIVAEFNGQSIRGQISLWSWDGIKAQKLRTLPGSGFRLSADGITLYTFLSMYSSNPYGYRELSVA